MRPQLSILSFISSTLITFLHAGEWNQHRGPFSNNKSDESISGSNWLKSSSSLQWKVQTPLGFSSFTTYNGNAYTLIAEEDEDGLMREICISLDLKTGKRQWSSHLGIMDYKAGGGNSGASDNKGGDGPRSTPSVLDGLVWAYDSDMSLYCLTAKDGKLIWKVNVLKEHDGINPRWENASSPLIVDDLVIIYGGGPKQSFLAFDKNSGKVKWKTGSELATHATPILTKIHGVEQVIFFCQSGLVSLLPKSGEELWRQEFPYKVSTAASVPPVMVSVPVFTKSANGEANFSAVKSGVNPMM
jgi:outer membrane protein assembly factor BamB